MVQTGISHLRSLLLYARLHSASLPGDDDGWWWICVGGGSSGPAGIPLEGQVGRAASTDGQRHVYEPGAAQHDAWTGNTHQHKQTADLYHYTAHTRILNDYVLYPITFRLSLLTTFSISSLMMRSHSLA